MHASAKRPRCSDRWTRVTLWLCLVGPLGWTGAIGCDSDDAPAPDGGADAVAPLDAPSGSEGPVVLPSIDFTVIGCPLFDATIPRCSGPAPLTVSFAPIVSGTVTRFLWDFGDQTTSSDPLPTHTYALPDSYDVTLLGAPGLLSPPRPGFIHVTPNVLGGSCDINPQCEAPLSCVCGEAAQCPSAFFRGLCTSSCAQTACPTGAVCADLARGLATTDDQTWRRPLCVRPCTADGDCARGQRCRTLPVTTPTPGEWGRGCFFDYPADPGSACRGPNGETQDAVCLGGRCADIGARGMCSVDCASAPCPTGTSCARFPDGRQLCLRGCNNDARPCDDDPLIACVAAGGMGPLAFTIVRQDPGADAGAPDAAGDANPDASGDAAGVPDASAPAAPTTLCSAKRCTSDVACLPGGLCRGAPAGHCVPRP